jgi:hypothetical protein
LRAYCTGVRAPGRRHHAAMPSAALPVHRLIVSSVIRTRALAVGLCCMITGAAASAQSPPTDQRESAAAAAGILTATLVVGNRRIITLRSALGALSARERVDGAAARIEELAETDSRDSTALARIPLGIVVRVGSQGVFAITSADVDSAAAQTLERSCTDTSSTSSTSSACRSCPLTTTSIRRSRSSCRTSGGTLRPRAMGRAPCRRGANRRSMPTA